MFLALFVYDAVGLIVTSIAIISGALNPLGWMIVLVYLFFTLGFGYFPLPKGKDLQEN